MTNVNQFAAQMLPSQRGDSGPGVAECGFSHDVPQPVPASRPASDWPPQDWIEQARIAFARRWHAENGDLIDNCVEVYRD